MRALVGSLYLQLTLAENGATREEAGGAPATGVWETIEGKSISRSFEENIRSDSRISPALSEARTRSKTSSSESYDPDPVEASAGARARVKIEDLQERALTTFVKYLASPSIDHRRVTAGALQRARSPAEPPSGASKTNRFLELPAGTRA